MELVSDLNIYQCSLLLKNNIPYKTGNMRHNATGIFFIGISQSAMGVDPAEASYAEDVLKLYEERGDNFMERALLDIYDFLNTTLNDGNPSFNQEYLTARQNVLSTAKTTIDRNIKNRQYGTGRYAGKSIYR